MAIGHELTVGGKALHGLFFPLCVISLSVNLSNGNVDYLDSHDHDLNIELIDTGQWTNTGGRIKRLAPFFRNEPFLLTWGDGVSTVNIRRLVDFHRTHGKLATVTAVRPPARFGRLEIVDDQVVNFSEKPQIAQGWINGAFFVLEPGVMDYIEGDHTQWEKEPMERCYECS